jgi:internalin A
MRKSIAETLGIAVLTGTLVHTLAATASAQNIPDKNLESALRALVFDKKDTTKELTDEDLKKIFVLEAKGKAIHDLTGLEKCTNLQLINFAKNDITDLASLKGLANLQSLDLSQNQVADVTPIGGLTALQFLELSNNQIADVQPLGKLSKLSALYMAGNKIKEVTPLGELTRLSSLDLAKNEVSNISPLSKLSGLSLLKLSDNRIEDISGLPKPMQIRMLLLERNKISDLASLVSAAKADAEGEKRFAPFLRLYLTGNPLSEVAQKDQLAALKTYGVRIEQSGSKESSPTASGAPSQSK